MAPPSVRPLIDYAPPVREAAWPSRWSRFKKLLFWLAVGVVLVATGVLAFQLTGSVAGIGLWGLLGLLVVAALCAHGGRPRLPKVVVTLLNLLALLLRIASILSLTFMLLVALQCLQSAHRPWDGWLLLLMLAVIPVALELLRALVRWSIGRAGWELTWRWPQGDHYRIHWVALPGIAWVWIKKDGE